MPTMNELRPLTIIAALVALGVIVLRILSPRIRTGFDKTALVLFAIAVVALLLPIVTPYVRKLSIENLFAIEFSQLGAGLATIVPGETLKLPRGVIAEFVVADRIEEEWRRVKDASRDVLIAHVLKPSPRNPVRGMMWYDLHIYLTRTQSGDVSDVKGAEFYLGPWFAENRAFRVARTDGRIGITTAAYGPTLCVCRITFEDGHQAFVYRMIDFEMARVFELPTR